MLNLAGGETNAFCRLPRPVAVSLSGLSVMRLLRKPTTQPDLTDDQLVERCRDGHPEAFGTLYDRHLPGLYAHAYRMLGDKAAAEDAAHDTLAKAWASLPSYRPGNFRAWLFSILHNLCIDRLRRQRPDVGFEGRSELAGSASVETEAIDLATIDQIAALLNNFPEAQRATVAMKMSGLKYREIAIALGKTEAAVAQDYSRAIKRLAEAMEGDRVAAAAGEGGRS
jgi:RNA polymerase sigma-70 factor (ECF subfamily)